VAELTLENRLLKKARSGLGGTAYEISRRTETGDIRLVEQSPLPVRHTLVKLGIPRATFTAGTTATAVVGRKP
jgi:hypothetical protein